MGLDQRLFKKTYIKNWDYMKPEDRHEVTVTKNGSIVDHIKPERVAYVIEEVATWRKANQIQKWIEDNVYSDNGDHNGEEIWVSRDTLAELLQTINTVLKASKLIKGKIANGQTLVNGEWQDNLEDGEYIEDSSVAQKLLPTGEGFFFGSTNYDQWYYQDLEYTRDILTELLDEAPNGDLYYEADW